MSVRSDPIVAKVDFPKFERFIDKLMQDQISK